MPEAVRLGDTCSGHGAFPPRANSESSSNVFINGKGAHRMGDKWESHTDDEPTSHDSTASEGSPSVFVNGKPKARVGDGIGCGSKMATGSGNVFVN